MKIIFKCFTTNFFRVNEATAQIRDSERTGGCEKLTRCRKEPHQNQNYSGNEDSSGIDRQWGARLAGGRSKQRKVREEMKEPWLVLLECEDTSAARRTWM